MYNNNVYNSGNTNSSISGSNKFSNNINVLNNYDNYQNQRNLNDFQN